MKKILLFVLLLISATSYSQKVGVVLSGGGAKGLAHIGVLKALEENNIPIDYIVGTSMGGVVGGSYAAGYSPDEIEYMVLDDQFLNWINGRPEDDFNYNFYNKDENASLFSIRLALDSTFNPQFNTTIADDFSLNFALAEKLSQPAANANYNFDSLFIPFRVVASEVFTQKSEILKEGSLSNAIRAALSVPFFYKPIKIDGRYLFDGGIYNNFPTDVAKAEFNPDFLIGVNVSSKVFEGYPYDRDTELISNSLFYMLLDKSDLMPDYDSSSVYIEPNLIGYTALDFDKAEALIDSGYNAAMRMMPKLLERIESRSNCEDLVERRNRFNSKNMPYQFSSVEVYEFNERQKKFIKKLFRSKNDYITLEEIKKSYFRLMSEPFFQSIYPSIRYDEESKLFVLELHGRPQNDLSIELGGNISSRNSSAIYLGGEFYYFSSFLLDTYFNAYGGNFYKSAQLKSRMYFPSLGHWYIEPDFTYNNLNYLEVEDILVDEESPTILDRSDRNYGLNAGIPLGLKYKLELSGGYFYNKDNFSNNEELMFTDTLDFMRISGHKAGFKIFRNTLNKKMFPTEGLFIQFSSMYYRINEKYVPGSTSTATDVVYDNHNWFQGKFHFEKFHKYGNKSTGYLLEAVVSNQPSFSSPMGTIIYLPAFNPLIDSRTLLIQNFRSSSYIAGGVRQIYEFNPKFNIRLEGHVFKEMGSIINSSESTRYNFSKKALSFAASASLVYTTPLGPFNLSFNYYDDKETQFGVLLNFGYLIFNKSSIE